MSAYYEAKVMNSIFSNAAFPSVATMYVGLSTQSIAGGTTDAAILAGEPSSTGAYARIALTNNSTNWPTYTSTGQGPANKLWAAGPGPTGVGSWPASTGSGWSTGATPLVTCFFADAATLGAGNLIWYGTVAAGAVNAAGILLSFAANAASLNLL